jgi:hypothetical protein
VVVAAGSQESAPLDPIHCPLKASSSAGCRTRPSLHLRERNSSMKNRKRESCTSGTVRDEGGNILIYSAVRQSGADLKPPQSEPVGHAVARRVYLQIQTDLCVAAVLARAKGLNRYRDSAHFEVGSQLIGQP